MTRVELPFYCKLGVSYLYPVVIEGVSRSSLPDSPRNSVRNSDPDDVPCQRPPTRRAAERASENLFLSVACVPILVQYVHPDRQTDRRTTPSPCFVELHGRVPRLSHPTPGPRITASTTPPSRPSHGRSSDETETKRRGERKGRGKQLLQQNRL